MGYICMLVDGAYPNDIRVRKEAEALALAGKKVLVVTPAKTTDTKEESINGVQVYRIGRNYTFIQKGIYDIIESVLNVNPFFYVGLKRVFKKYEIDYLHIHDLPLAGTGYLFKSKVQKLILDLHENFPEALKTWFEWKKNPIIKLKNFIFMNPSLWMKKEANFCRKYDLVICVVEEMKEKLMTNFNIDPKKLFVISNYEKKEFASNFSSISSQSIINKERFSITYVGGFGPHRGLDTAIEAMQHVIKKVPNATLYLIGKGSKDVEQKLRDLALKYKVENCVEFVGYRPFNEVASIMQSSNINIIPHKANEHTNNTIPHKLFQIMMSNSLLLVSSCKPLKRIVEKYDAGFVFEANNAQDFSDTVIYIHSNNSRSDVKTENAYTAVMEEGENWDTESLKLIKLYNQLEN